METELIFSVAVPVFVMVMVCPALVPPTNCEPNVRLEGDTETDGAAVTPVPVSGITCGLVEELSTIVRLALLDPATVGENFRLSVQDCPGVRT